LPLCAEVVWVVFAGVFICLAFFIQGAVSLNAKAVLYQSD
jgi:hypothetical protein